VTLPKLGEVIQGESQKFIVTARFPHGINLGGGGGFAVLTPIPKRCKPKDLGKKFQAAHVMYADIEPNEKLYEWSEMEKA